jgi:hypothetical protein
MGRLGRIAIHGGAGAEHHAPAAVVAHGAAGGHQAADVVAVVGQRLGGGLAHRLERGEMHHGVDVVM